MSPRMEIRLLGEYKIAMDGAPVRTTDSARLQALLAFLIIHRDAAQPRRRIAFLFWPNTSDQQALTNLRQLLHRLRARLPDADTHLDLTTDSVQWRSRSSCVSDVALFESAVARASETSGTKRYEALQSAVDAYGGELLPGCYDEWLLSERERLSHQYALALEQLVFLHEEGRRYSDAIELARKLVQHDQLREASYRILMRLLALQGDRAAALRVFHDCRSILERELGVAPSETTHAIYDQLVRADDMQVQPSSSDVGLLLVGRQQEWMVLQEAWRITLQAGVRCVAISGESGIGKTRLAEEMVNWARRQGIRTATMHAYPGIHDLAFTPLVESLQSEPLAPFIRNMDSHWRTELSRLLPDLLADDPDLPPPERLTERWQRQRLFEALARVFVADGHTMLLYVDDLQWYSREMLEWLAFLARFQPQARLLLLMSFRADEFEADHPAVGLLRHLRSRGLLEELMLAPLSSEETASLALELTGQVIDEGAARTLYEFTEGNPLFVIETLRSKPLFSELRRALADTKRFPTSRHLPTRVQAVIEARLAQLSSTAQEIARIAATIGRSFAYSVLALACDYDEPVLVEGLDELWQRGIVREVKTTTYDFTHDRIRDVVYITINPTARKLLHRRVAVALEQVHAGNLDIASARIAGHLREGGDSHGAIVNYQRAAGVELGQFAYEEAIALADSAMALLDTVPAGAVSLELELELQMQLCSAWAAKTSYTGKEAEQAYARALELCHQVRHSAHLFTVLWGLHEIALYRADFPTSVELAQQCLDIAREFNDQGLLLEAHHALWGPYYFLGEYDQALAHMRKGLALYDRAVHEGLSVEYGVHDACACALSQAALACWNMGFLEQAQEWQERLVVHKRDLTMPANIADAGAYAGLYYHLVRDLKRVQLVAEEALAISTDKGYPFSRFLSAVELGWSLALQGNTVEGVALARQGMAASLDAGNRMHHSQLAVMLAETNIVAGHYMEAVDTADEAIESFRVYRDLLCAPDLWLFKGEALRLLGAPMDDVEKCIVEALNLARALGARVSELRAATSLARLQKRHGRVNEDRHALQSAYAWFSEGHATSELSDALLLLHELR